ncbi:MAG: fumarate hydratase C-terminal domain-containing protein [Victivallales bacterium]|nr:fumarate hydratase C-terminal domain-containing protein [Victivallales bacterium]
MISLQLPLAESDIRALSCGDEVALTGVIYTARDAAHKYLAGAPDPTRLPDLQNAVLYHCGPVIIRRDGEWVVTAAGPTTSIREEPYMAEVIRRYRLKAVIGKGGMGADTLAACREHGCVYLSAVGGAAQVMAQSIRKVTGVYMLEEFGAPEALWELQVADMPLIVTMDTHGGSLHRQTLDRSHQALSQLMER